MKFNKEMQLHEILSTEKGQVVLKKYAPNLFSYPGNAYLRHEHYSPSLEAASENKMLGITPEVVDKILDDLANPDEEILRFIPRKQSLDELDALSFKAKYRPLEGDAIFDRIKRRKPWIMKKKISVFL